MAIVPDSTSQGNPSDGNPDPLPSFGNVSASYVATLSLLGFTIGFLVWLFSTPMVPNIQTHFSNGFSSTLTISTSS